MSNEINKNTAIELCEQELDMVAGGSDENSLDSFFGASGSSFEQFALFGSEATFAGPQGAGTQGSIGFQGTVAEAFKGFGAFGSGSDE